jgi:hypothetical protein
VKKTKKQVEWLKSRLMAAGWNNLRGAGKNRHHLLFGTVFVIEETNNLFSTNHQYRNLWINKHQQTF